MGKVKDLNTIIVVTSKTNRFGNQSPLDIIFSYDLFGDEPNEDMVKLVINKLLERLKIK